MSAESMQDRLIFVIGSPRSGSTLLSRMLGSHSCINSRPEPHLMTPIHHLGYYANIEKAPYDHFNAAQAIHEFVDDLPGGEEDYLDALRAYADTLYARMQSTSGKQFFLDKTPAYALSIDFITKVYPKAKYVVLTRHPLAILSSYANSFFDGDYDAALGHNKILQRYVPAIAKFLDDDSIDKVHVRYEDLVSDPATHLRRIFDYCGLEFEEGAVEYGKNKPTAKGLGDPINVDRLQRPTTASIEKWAGELASDPDKLELARQEIESIEPAALKRWGYTSDEIWSPIQLGTTDPKRVQRKMSRYILQRKLLVAIRRNVHDSPLGLLLGRVRFALDVLLREPLG